MRDVFIFDDRSTYSRVCSLCAHWTPGPGGWWRCDAFDRIPDDIWEGKNDHRRPYPGDRGALFEANTVDR